MINLTVTDIFTTEFYTIKRDIWLFSTYLCCKRWTQSSTFFSILYRTYHFMVTHSSSTNNWGVGSYTEYVLEWFHCPHATLISGPTFNPLCTQKFSMVDGGPQNCQNWRVGPYLGQYSRHKHVMFKHTGQMGNLLSSTMTLM